MSETTLESPRALLNGVELAVQMLNEGHERNRSGDAFIIAKDRDGQAQNRYVLRYLERLTAEPELVAGFVAALSDYIMVTAHSTFDPDIYRRLTAAQIVGRGPRAARHAPSEMSAVKKTRGTYYNPPTEIADVPGVTKKQCPLNDFYSGTLEALVATGLATVDMFPGQPGRGVGGATYRPVGAVRGDGWHTVPGYLSIHRYLDNKFQVRLTVSRDEQERRAAAERDEVEARREARRCEGYAARQSPPAVVAHAAPRPGHLHIAWSAPAAHGSA